MPLYFALQSSGASPLSTHVQRSLKRHYTPSIFTFLHPAAAQSSHATSTRHAHAHRGCALSCGVSIIALSPAQPSFIVRRDFRGFVHEIFRVRVFQGSFSFLSHIYLNSFYCALTLFIPFCLIQSLPRFTASSYRQINPRTQTSHDLARLQCCEPARR